MQNDLAYPMIAFLVLSRQTQLKIRQNIALLKKKLAYQYLFFIFSSLQRSIQHDCLKTNIFLSPARMRERKVKL